MNNFQNLDILLNDLRNSDIPERRKCYLDSIKSLIEIGKKLDQLNPSSETKKGIERLEKIIENYKV